MTIIYTWRDMIPLEREWYEAFGDDSMPQGFGVGPEQIPILKECIRLKSTKPIDDYLKYGLPEGAIR